MAVRGEIDQLALLSVISYQSFESGTITRADRPPLVVAEGPVVIAAPPTPPTPTPPTPAPAAAAEAATPCVAWAAAAAAAATCLMLRQLQSGFVTPRVHRALDHMVALLQLLTLLLLAVMVALLQMALVSPLAATFRPRLLAPC